MVTVAAFPEQVPAVRPEAVPVQFVNTPPAGVPNSGATNIGEVANTKLPLPVSSLILPANSDDVVEDNADILSVV